MQIIMDDFPTTTATSRHRICRSRRVYGRADDEQTLLLPKKNNPCGNHKVEDQELLLPKKSSFGLCVSSDPSLTVVVTDFPRGGPRSHRKKKPIIYEGESSSSASAAMSKKVKKVSKSIQKNVTNPFRERVSLTQKSSATNSTSGPVEKTPLLNMASLAEEKLIHKLNRQKLPV